MKKKALLIGIGYKESKSQPELYLPHEDVMKLRGFLIKAYGYSEKDITVMLDKPGELQPTQRNIRQQAYNLVAGAAPGDHFLFYYSGHSVQVPELKTEEQTELDGLDEVMVPSDGHTANHESTRQSCLVDNELKRLLINPLPAEASFMAILDTCHSASLLDLDHGDCNAKWSCLRDTTQFRKIVPLHNAHPSPTPSNKPGPRSSLTRKAEMPCARIPYTGKKMPGAFHGFRRSESPIPDRCHMPLVISLSACRDDQTTIENYGDKAGRSFTERLLNILRDDPKPRLRDLMTKISISIHGMLLNAVDLEKLDKIDGCQDPQMASGSELDMESHLETL
ncbi:peptidase C14, caspase domain-containing protein [Mycena capillaripes]|nr:peptidase C14, caspase domain-containing protein [Mycena capillaripes]